jgi:hypothetical protein
MYVDQGWTQPTTTTTAAAATAAPGARGSGVVPTNTEVRRKPNLR